MIRGSEFTGPGLWANLACRKRFIDDKLNEALDDIDAVVILGAGLDTSRLPADSASSHPGLRGGPAASTSPARPRRCAGCSASRRCRFGWWPLDFEHDDLLTVAGRARLSHRLPGLLRLGRRHPVPHRGRPSGARSRDCARPRRAAGSCSPTSAATSSTARNRYGTRTLYRNVRQRQQLWQFGLQPDEVAEFLGDYGWRLVEQAGPDELRAALRRAHRPRAHGVADRVVGVRGEDLSGQIAITLRGPSARSSAGGGRSRPPTCRRCGARPGRCGPDR